MINNNEIPIHFSSSSSNDSWYEFFRKILHNKWIHKPKIVDVKEPIKKTINTPLQNTGVSNTKNNSIKEVDYPSIEPSIVENRQDNENISPQLSVESSFDSSINNCWIKPSQHGLENSVRIIPMYYFTNHSYDTLFHINYYDMILDDIRNLRKLNEYQINYISTLDNTKKLQIIKEFNDIVINYCQKQDEDI